MKNRKGLALTLVLGLGLLAGLAWPVLKPGAGPEPAANFAAFRERKLELPERQEPVCLVAVGDVMLSRGVARAAARAGDVHHPFAKVKSILHSGDIVFGNLECPITAGREIMITEMVLRADPEAATALGEAGFTLLSLANNHLPDFGPRGLADTLGYLDDAGIGHVGAGKTAGGAQAPRVVEAGGMKLAFLAFTDPGLFPENRLPGEGEPTMAFLEEERLRLAVKGARQAADFVVFSLHAGTEYAQGPDRGQVRFARLAVDAGADLVLGHHPHVVQRVEKYRGKYIIYSLGNFVFDQLWSRPTREGLAAKIYIGRQGVEKMEFIPVFIGDDTRPRVLGGREAGEVLQRLGLKLQESALPVWDEKQGVWQEGRRYTYYARRQPRESRLAKEQSFDLDRDGRLEELRLRDGRLRVAGGGQLIWETPREWWVDDFLTGDANNDGVPDLSLLVWKAGSFGANRPFWVEQDDPSVKNHLFIFKMADGAMKPLWQSSNLDRPNLAAALADLDGDGKNELIATEGSYANPRERKTTLWQWNGWGFSMVF